MTLSQEVKFIQQGADLRKIKQDKSGRFTKETMRYLETKQIAY